MKKKFKFKLIALLAAVASLFLLGGCKIGESLDELRANRNLTAQVTYYANGGIFDGTVNKTSMEMHYQANSPVLDIGHVSTSAGTASVTRSNYDFEGWYYVKLDASGNPLFEDEAKTVPQMGKKVEFPLTIQEGQHLYFTANWSAHLKVDVILVCEDANAKIPEDGTSNTYEVNKSVEAFTYDGNVVKSPGSGSLYAPFKVKGDGYTFADYYWDKACTDPVVFPIQKEENQTTDKTIYAKYLVGRWVAVREPSNVKAMIDDIRTGKTNKYSVTRDIDMKDVYDYKYLYHAPIGEFNAQIDGNGFEIKNMKVGATKQSGKVSFFGTIAATAVIKNLTFTNMSFEYGANGDLDVYYSFTEIKTGAQVENVKIHAKLTVTKSGGATVVERSYGNTETTDSDDEYSTATNGEGFVVEKITE